MKQVASSNTTGSSLSNVTAEGEGGDRLRAWQLFRDALKWGMVRVFGSVAEPYDSSTTGTDKVVHIVVVERMTKAYMLS